MRPYGIIDLHCDTLTECKYTNTGNPDTLDDPKRVLSLSNMPVDVKWAQFFAIWIQDEYRGKEAVRFFDVNADNFYRQMELFSDRVAPCRTFSDIENAWFHGKRAALLTVENGSAIGGDLANISHLADRGVRCVTIVWNGENEIGSGHKTQNGLSPFGMEAVREFERQGILIDVSHLNDSGFYNLIDQVTRPFMATHSNARSICAHKRNLTDDMIKLMVERGCLIGLNYYINFIDDSGDAESPDKLYRHIDHFLNLGAEKNIALGSDFDGSLLPGYLNSPEGVASFYDYLLGRGLPQKVVDGIFWENASAFLKEHL